MPFEIVRNDITKMHVDAIVNAANKRLEPGGGVCGAIHAAAGPQLAAECRLLGGCETGEAKATFAYNLPCKYVIHTVGPVWNGGEHGEREALVSSYRESLKLAKEKGCDSIAFPLISSGIFGYPKKEALRVAIDTIGDFLTENEMMVYLAVFNKECLNISKALFANIEEYIDEHYVDEHEAREYRRRRYQEEELAMAAPKAVSKRDVVFATVASESVAASDADIDEWLEMIDESFSEMLLRKIKEKGMSNAECYKKANIDKKLFSKIKGDHGYVPKKSNVLAFAVALELSLDETREMLFKAGMALSHSDKFDLIVEFCIVNKIYDIFEINQILFNYDQPLLGNVIF